MHFYTHKPPSIELLFKFLFFNLLAEDMITPRDLCAISMEVHWKGYKFGGLFIFKK